MGENAKERADMDKFNSSSTLKVKPLQRLSWRKAMANINLAKEDNVVPVETSTPKPMKTTAEPLPAPTNAKEQVPGAKPASAPAKEAKDVPVEKPTVKTPAELAGEIDEADYMRDMSSEPASALPAPTKAKEPQVEVPGAKPAPAPATESSVPNRNVSVESEQKLRDALAQLPQAKARSSTPSSLAKRIVGIPSVFFLLGAQRIVK